MTEYTLHPYALLFPPMTESEYIALKESIRENGQRDPIVLWGDLDNQSLPMEQCPVLDGRNRLRACEELGEKPKTIRRFMTEAEALQYVLDANLHRRHLTDGQRAAIAAEIPTLKVGRPAESATEEIPPIGGISQPEAAEKLNVSLRSTQRAAAVKEENNALHALIKEGAITPSLAEQVAKLTKEQQEGFLDKVHAGAKPAEVYAALKRETESTRIVSELLDTTQVTPQADHPSSQFEETPTLPIHEFPVEDGFLSATHHPYLMGVTFHKDVLSAPPVKIDGQLWVCWRSSRNDRDHYDTAECLAVMPMDDYIDARLEPGSMLVKEIWYNQWQEQVDEDEREPDDFRGLKMSCVSGDAIGYYVCLEEKRKFFCALPVSDDDADANDEAEDTITREDMIEATVTSIEETPMVIMDYLENLMMRWQAYLSEPEVLGLYARFAPAREEFPDFPTYWETVLLGMVRRIAELEAVADGQGVLLHPEAVHLLQRMAERRSQGSRDKMTANEYLMILIAQKAEQMGIVPEEVAA